MMLLFILWATGARAGLDQRAAGEGSGAGRMTAGSTGPRSAWAQVWAFGRLLSEIHGDQPSTSLRGAGLQEAPTQHARGEDGNSRRIEALRRSSPTVPLALK
jgi:hypothetical protein